ncbi:TonB-dependent receptor domain-containing protein [Pelagibius sp.]
MRDAGNRAGLSITPVFTAGLVFTGRLAFTGVVCIVAAANAAAANSDDGSSGSLVKAAGKSLAVSAAQLAQAEAISVDIPSQPLSDALRALSRQTGLQFFAGSELTQGLTAPAVSGRMSADDALRRLLEGSGLTYRYSGSDVVALERNRVIAENGPIRLDPIIVEGELLTRTLQDTQTSAVVIRGEELEQRSDPDIFTVIERTPGVNAAAGNSDIAIRGIPSFGFAAGRGNGQAVSTIVDGASLSNVSAVNSRIPHSTWDLEQIEILRGPQSTQTGRNALAGSVNIQSKDPTFEYEAKARGELANLNTQGGALAVNVPLVEDVLAVRVSGDYERTDGFIENSTLGIDDAGDRENTTLRATVRLQPTEEFTATLKYFHIDSKLGEVNVDESLFSDDRTVTVDVPGFSDSRVDSVTLNLSYELTDDFAITSKTNYFEGDKESLEDGDFSNTPGSSILRNREGENFQQEVLLSYDRDPVRGVLGLFYADIEESSFTQSESPGLTALLESTAETQNAAVFGEIEVDVLSDLRLIGGLRYDREKTSTRADAFDAEATFDAFLPKAGIVYDVTDDLSVGFTVQRGYRAGGVVSNFAGQPDAFDPEFTWNYEASVRSQWLNKRVTANANFFYTSWKDQQVLQIVPAGPPFFLDVEVTNAGKSRLFGGEFELTALATENLEVFASGAFVRTEFQEFVALGQDFSGNEFNYAPRFSAAAGATYWFDNGVFISADGSYTDNSFDDTANTTEIDSRLLVNARIGYEAENFEIFAFARNLLDRDYAVRRFSGVSMRLEPGEPLAFGIVGKVRF